MSHDCLYSKKLNVDYLILTQNLSSEIHALTTEIAKRSILFFSVFVGLLIRKGTERGRLLVDGTQGGAEGNAAPG